MPNWVINNFTAKGTKKDLIVFADAVKTEESEFDFNTMIPMPESLNMTSGGSEDEAILYFLSERLTKSKDDLVEDKVLDAKLGPIDLMFYGSKSGWIEEHIKRVKRDIPEKSPEELDDLYELGRKYVDNIVRYGASSWYEWCCDNWGTKWPASDVCVSPPAKCGRGFSIDIYFDTAWSAPIPVFRKMIKMFPKISFEGEYADEDIGSNCGQWKSYGGNVLVNDMSMTEEGTELACRMWGYDPDELDMDDEDEEDTADYDDKYVDEEIPVIEVISTPIE